MNEKMKIENAKLKKKHQLPVGWEICQLGDLCDVVTKGTTPTSVGHSFVEDGVNFVKVESIALNGEFLLEKFDHITTETHAALRRSQLKNQDILFSIAGALGRTAIVSNNILPANTNQALAIIRLRHSTTVYNKYVILALNSGFTLEQVQGVKAGVAQQNLSLTQVKIFLIPLPPLAEQKRIAGILDKADEIRKKRKESLKLAEEFIKSTFLEMFGDPVNNPKGWEVEPLGEICDVRDGTHDSPKFIANGYPLVTSKNIKNGNIDFSDIKYISEKDFININKRSKVDIGDIIMPMIGTIGNPIIIAIDSPFAIKNVALIKFTKSDISNLYLLSLLKSHYFLHSIKDINRGGTQKFISLGDIRKISIPVPPLDLQQKFAAIVEKQQNMIKKMEKERLDAENLFNALSQKAFNGEL